MTRRTLGERVTALEERADATDRRLEAGDRERAEIIDKLNVITGKLTFSRGAMIGGMTVITALGGIVMWAANAIVGIITDFLHNGLR